MNLRTFDLNLLRVLDALLREQSVTRAGERLGLSQPAVSAALGRLRAATGDPLFVRQGQGLTPTPYAASLAMPLREALDGLEALMAPPGVYDPRDSEDVFKISGSDFFAEMLMPKLARRLARIAPGVRVQLVDLVPENYAGTIERYEVDIALVPQMAFPDWIEQRPVFRSSFAVIARRDHPALTALGLVSDDIVPIDAFCALGHVLFSPEGALRAMGDAALARMGRARRVVMSVPVFSGVACAVAESDHIALLPRQLAWAVRDRLGLEVYRPPMPIEPAVICMIWHKRMGAVPAHRWLREQVYEALAPLDEAGPSED